MLEEVDQKLSISISGFDSSSAGQNDQLLWSVAPRWLFPKTFIVSISMSSDHREGSAIRFFLQLNNQTLLYRWLY